MSLSQVTAFILGSAVGVYLLRQRSRSAYKPRFFLGVDFGGTAMKLGVLDGEGRILGKAVVPVAASKTPEDVIDQIARAAQDLIATSNLSWSVLSGCGVCCPGRVENGVVSTVANLAGWSDVPLATLLQIRLGVPVRVCNDANAALAGEMWSGGARNCKDAVMITLGTGVGGAVCSQNRILTGYTGMFGEVGHHIICVGGRLSKTTGVKGIAEEYCSAQGIKYTWMELSGDAESPDPQWILQHAEAGTNELALKVATITAKYVGALIVNCCRAYDPERIVLGGGLCSSDWFIEQCKIAAQEMQWTLAAPTYTVEKARHGNWAGVVGAANIIGNE